MKKAAIVGVALVLAGALMFGVGFIGARGDLSVVNGNFGPFRVQFTEGSVHSGFYTSGSGSAHGIGGGRDKPVTTPPPAIYTGAPADGSGTQNSRSFTAEGVREIIITELYADVELCPSDDGQIHVSAEERDNFYCEMSLSDGKLRIERKSSGINVGFGLDTNELSTLRVCVPADIACGLDVENSYGDITVSDLSFGEVELDTSLGDVSFENISCKKAQLDSSYGGVLAQNVECAGDLSAQADMGAVLVDNVHAGLKLEAESDCGSVTVCDSSARELELSSDMGDVGVFDTTAQDRAELDCSCGSIEFRALSVGREIEIENDMGSVEGTLAGSINDYSIESKASLGSNNLPGQLRLGEISLKVFTDCGSIDISFEES